MLYYKLERILLTFIEGPNQAACIRLLSEHRKRLYASPGSVTKHQAWVGGFVHHLEETMNIAIRLYDMMNAWRPLNFTLSDVFVILFLHDLEKPFKYISPKMEFEDDAAKLAFIKSMVEKYGFQLTEAHWNGIKYIHGEGKDFSPNRRVQLPITAFAHMCDVASARIWFNEPKQNSRKKTNANSKRTSKSVRRNH